MCNGWAVRSVGPSGPQKSKKVFTWVLLKQQKQALPPSQAWGRKTVGGQTAGGLAGWVGAASICRTVCWFVETQSSLGRSSMID